MEYSHIAEPKPDVKAPWVRRLKAREKALLKIADVAPQWIVTHWVATKGTVACEAARSPDGKVVDLRDCAACRAHDPERIRGYMYVWNLTLSRHEFFELTLNVWLSIKAQAMHVKDLRGWSLTAWRGNGGKARIEAEITRPDFADQVGNFDLVPSVDASLRTLTRRR